MLPNDAKPGDNYDPKQDIKEHATDKFTEEKVEKEVPEVEAPPESIVTELEVDES